MSESTLKKEFKKSDVQRLRNLITGKMGEKTSIGIGYDKKYEDHKEGDIWEQDGRKWTIVDGIKQNITKLDKAKQEIHLPLFCPSCESLMKHKYDKKFYIQYKRCYDCQLKFEQELKVLGLWEEYEKTILNSDIDNMVEMYSTWIDELINDKGESFITESGDLEKWLGSAKSKLLENKEETIKFLQNLKK